MTYDWMGVYQATDVDLLWAFRRYDRKHPELADHRFMVTEQDGLVISVSIVGGDAANGLWTLAEIRADKSNYGISENIICDDCDEVAAMMVEAIRKWKKGCKDGQSGDCSAK